jgi:hypothetical protein
LLIIHHTPVEDFGAWSARLHVYGLDMRYLQAVEKFCQFMKKAYTHLDIIINNAAQTIRRYDPVSRRAAASSSGSALISDSVTRRRPPAYYEHLIAAESVHVASLPEPIRDILQPPRLPVKPWGNDYLLPLFSTPSSSSSSSTSLLTTGPGAPLAPSCPPATGGPVIEEPADDHETMAMTEEDEQRSAHDYKTTEDEAIAATTMTTTSAALPNISAGAWPRR